jgi:uncharacterized membrane protein YeaQ/YmgE (transglycosylase-associated protein family)
MKTVFYISIGLVAVALARWIVLNWGFSGKLILGGLGAWLGANIISSLEITIGTGFIAVVVPYIIGFVVMMFIIKFISRL